MHSSKMQLETLSYNIDNPKSLVLLNLAFIAKCSSSNKRHLTRHFIIYFKNSPKRSISPHLSCGFLMINVMVGFEWFITSFTFYCWWFGILTLINLDNAVSSILLTLVVNEILCILSEIGLRIVIYTVTAL